MGGRDQSQAKIKVKKFEKVKSVPKTYQKVITMTRIKERPKGTGGEGKGVVSYKERNRSTVVEV